MKGTKGFKQRGFTLIELMVVIIVVGVLMAIFLPNLMNPNTRTTAMMLERNAQTVSDSFNMLSMSCGISKRVDDSPIDDLELVLLGGLSHVDDAYTTCYRASGITPNISAVAIRDGDVFLDGEYKVTIADNASGAPRAFTISYDDVPEDVAATIALDYANEVSDVTAGGSGDFGGDGESRAPLNLDCSDSACTVMYRYFW